MLKATGAGSLNVTVPVAVASPGTSLLGVIASESTVCAGITSMALQRVTLLVAQTVTGAEALTSPVVNENVPVSCATPIVTWAGTTSTELSPLDSWTVVTFAGLPERATVPDSMLPPTTDDGMLSDARVLAGSNVIVRMPRPSYE